MSLTSKQKQFVQTARSILGDSTFVVTRQDIQRVVDESGLSFPHWLVTKSEHRYGRGEYKLPQDGAIHSSTPVETPLVTEMAQVLHLRQPKLIDESDSSIPEKYKDYVPFGFYKDLLNIIKSRMFYPVFITGLSGNGKTLMVEQVCAEQKRECIRVNISIETDESDLLGGPTLVNGNIVNRDGPVLTAMKKGAVLLIDEVVS